MSVATTILEQLGGRKFIAMTGAKNLIDGGDALSFTLPRGFARGGVNRVKVVLTPMDEYTVEFFRVRGAAVKVVARVEGVYFDQLPSVFTDHTGLYTHL